ncbi:MAG: hypothetical protein ACXWDK_11075, partial [Aeromicrobium sp.]
IVMTADSSDVGTPRERFEALASEVYEPIQRYVRRRVDPDAVDDVVSETLAEGICHVLGS